MGLICACSDCTCDIPVFAKDEVCIACIEGYHSEETDDAA